MSRYRLWGSVLVIPAVAVLLSTIGCGGSDKPKETPKPVDKGSPDGGQKSAESGSKATPASEKAALDATGVATLKGKVTYDGDPPPRKDLTPQMEQQQDKDTCLKGDTKDQLWIVGADKGIANVVVWLRPPEGKYFKIPADQQTPKEKVEMDQPQCAFLPHVVAINPSVWDSQAKKQKPSGQTFKILNNAPMNHNTAWSGNRLLNPGVNRILPPKTDLPVEAKACRDTQVGGEDLLSVSCDIHKWMTAKVAVFDHPYYAVTDLNGNYEIKNVPAGAEVVFTYWHESMDDKSLSKAKTEKITLKAGDNPPKDIKIK